MISFRLGASALLVIAALGSCRFNGALPADAVVTCGSRNECPTGSQCRANLNRCFPISTDVEAPEFTGVPTLAPLTGRLATVFTVTLSVSEELGDLPSVTGVCDIGETVAFTTEQARQARDFVFTWQVPDDSPQGVCRLQVRAFDRFGNLATAVQSLTFFIDSRPPTPSLAGIEFAAAPGSPVPEISALGLEGRVFLNFTTNEPVVGLPVLQATPNVIDFEPLEVNGAIFRARGRLKAGTSTTGIAELSVTLADKTGASGTQPLHTAVPLAFDGQPPRFNADAGLPHIRVPRGVPSTGGSAVREITGASGNIEAGVTVRALSADGFTEFGRVVTGAAGEFTLSLPPPDQALVTLEAVDAAGNRSTPILVPQVEFRVVPDYDTRVAGTTGDALIRFDGLTDVSAKLRAADGDAVVIEGNGSWRSRSQVRFRVAAPTLYAPALAYDPVRANVVEWLGTHVYRLYGADGDDLPGQALRAYAAMSYDRKRGVLVAFGGIENEEVQESTDGRVWRTINPINGPGPRQHHVLVFDGEATQMLGSPDLSPVLSWNGAAWSVVDAGTLPNGVVAAAYDSRRNRVVALASADGGSPETWAYARKHWQKVTLVADGGSGPPSAVGGMVYDSRADLIRFNGSLPDGGGERWSYADERWSDDGVGVSTSANAAATFDEARGIWFQAGLIGRAEYFTSLVAIQDGTLRQFATANDAPSIRFSVGSTWDPQRQSLVIHGGKPTSNQYPDDQWGFNGSIWQRDSVPPVGLPNLYNHSLTWSGNGNVVFGGYIDAGLLNNQGVLSGQTWVSVPMQPGSIYRAVAGVGPSPRADHSAICAGGSNVLVFGGINNDGLLWSFDGGVWAAQDGGVVERRQKMAVVKEPTTSTLMAIGGSDTASVVDATIRAATDDAVFLGGPSQWHRVASLPTARAGVVAVVDSDHDQVLVMGGRRADGTAIDEFLSLKVRDGGVTITPISTSDPEGDSSPQARYQHAAVYDDQRHAMLVYSGYNGAFRGFYDLWEYRFIGQRPSLTTSIDAREVDFSGVDSLVLTATVVAGAHGVDSAGASRDGFSVEAFVDGRWLEIGHLDTALPTAMKTFTASTGRLSVQQLAATLERISVRVVARGANGAEPAVLSVDALELALMFSRTP